MAKKELIRKILATILTVLGLVCGLVVCLWLLLGSDVFGTELRWLMIVCTGALAVAIVGLVICKVQEIRALAEIVRFDAERARTQQKEQLGGQPEEPPAPPQDAPPADDGPARPVMARVMNDMGVQDENGQSSPFVSIATPISAQLDEDEEEDTPDGQTAHRPWKPINFKAVDQQAQVEAEARRRALEQAQAAEAARRQAQAEAQRIAQEQARAEAAHQAELALQAEAQRQAEEAALKAAVELVEAGLGE